MRCYALSLLLIVLSSGSLWAQGGANLLTDPSVELTQEKNQYGVPYAKWGGWIFEGSPQFRVGLIARTGQSSAELVGASGGKLRVYTPPVTVGPGRYSFSCYVRGLDLGRHAWGLTEDLNFADEQYLPLKLSGTFGWTRLEIVKDVPVAKDLVARLGLWAPGRLWVDDAEIVKVAADTPLTAGVVVGEQEQPIAPPATLVPGKTVRCTDCGYLNMPQWGQCYACGATLRAATEAQEGPPSKQLASFEEGKEAPFTPAATAAVEQHATDGKFALRVDKDWAAWDGAMDWSGYDFIKADVFNAADTPAELYVEIRDKGTTGYWTRVNYNTVAPPGPSTLVVPTDLYVGEKSRPGRPLDTANLTRFVLSVGENPKGPVYFDNLRLERDLSDSVKVPGLQAYSFGPGTSPPLRGFTAVTPGTLYSPGRGYGLKDAQVWRAFDVLQPDPLYQTFICIEKGGFATDLPDGKYHVFVNIDNPSGFWGEYQVYRQRVIKANGVEVVNEKMDLQGFRRKYFRFADVEDDPLENTFDKYQRAYFSEKEFEVEVTGGQLYLEFLGENWANSVSALVIYPAGQADLGRQYLDNLRERRRFYFDNYFKRVLPDPHRDAKGLVPELVPSAQEQATGHVLFSRNWMEDINVNAVPRREEITSKLSVAASAGELEPIVFSVYPLEDQGEASVSVSALQGPGGAIIPASAVQPGVVSHRLSRVTMEGSVYTISPRFVMPTATATLKRGVTTTFWLTLHAPNPVKAGTYTGTITLSLPGGRRETLALSARLFATPLDECDIPAGSWGCSIDLPWYAEDRGDYDQAMFRKCLAKLREYGCTSFSGIPVLRVTGWANGKPQIDFRLADSQMADARAAGFKHVVVNYNGGIQGFNNYKVDAGAMQAAKFTNYGDFLKAVLNTVDEHARAAGWLPVAYNLCDEPLGDDISPTAENAKAWRDAAPASLLTTGATSIASPKPDDPHLPLVKALRIANLNSHDEAAIKIIHDAGNDWAFYNGGNRWTFGTYLYKCAKEYGLKFRLSWHWNASAGDPYYALDSREDDYSWCATNANMDLIPSLHFEREIREGLDDYRTMLTLARLLGEKPNHPAAAEGRRLLETKLAAFKLGERNHEAKWPVEEYATYRLSLAEAIEKLSR